MPNIIRLGAMGILIPLRTPSLHQPYMLDGVLSDRRAPDRVGLITPKYSPSYPLVQLSNPLSCFAPVYPTSILQTFNIKEVFLYQLNTTMSNISDMYIISNMAD